MFTGAQIDTDDMSATATTVEQPAQVVDLHAWRDQRTLGTRLMPGLHKYVPKHRAQGARFS